MGLLNIFNRRGDEPKPKKGKYQKIVSTVCIVGIFLAIALVVLGLCEILALNATTFGIIGTIASICIGGLLMLPWLACYEQGKFKKIAITFMGLDVAVPLLWIFAIWFLVGKVLAGSVGAGTLTFIKIVFLISLQFAVASIIANSILRNGKKLLLVQVIAYASFVYFDFYISFALCCISFTEADGIRFSDALSVLGNKALLTLFVLSLIYVMVAFSIINGRYGRRRGIGDVIRESTMTDDDNPKQEPVIEKKDDLEEQLQKLQNLLDKKLITQEEYDKKRQELIDKL